MVRISVLALLGSVVLLTASPSAAPQVGHPAKGSWIGYWGPQGGEQRRMLLVLDWEDHEIVGTINPGRNSADVLRSEIDYDTWTLTLEAELPLPDGDGAARWTATGRLENLGSWTNRKFTGSYRHGRETGTFDLTLN